MQRSIQGVVFSSGSSAESHDILIKSHDILIKSHDILTKSHDMQLSFEFKSFES